MSGGNGVDEEPEGSNAAAAGFLIVGLGGSAGAIRALREFFRNVPRETGMAFVVILHLSPDHDSQLAEILQQVAPIPVEQVAGAVQVKPDHIYVIPPNKCLAMRDGMLALSDVTGYRERRAPVDIFFRTLAETHRARAVSVILSGTGANGSMGLKRIKERGGLVIVQDPLEAEFGDMPRNSIATGFADCVLPVARIPERILAYRDQLATIRTPDEEVASTETDERTLHEIFTQLRVRTGHDFSNYKRATVMRRVARRMGVNEIADLPAYARFLLEQRDEARALLKDLLISVTNFFRDANAFAALERKVIPQLFEHKGPGDQVRVWVAGCATGEEAYSIAMLLAEYAARMASPPAVQVFASDLDAEAIATARDGFYTLNDVADVSPERLGEFFVKAGEGYRVRREMREMVLFAHHNLIKDPPFSHLDMASCRNLLIYFNRAAQQRALEVLHFALHPAGALFLGTSESADGAPGLFTTLDKEHHIYQARDVVPRIRVPDVDFTASAWVDRGETGVPASLRRPPGDLAPARVLAPERHRRLLELYGPPSIVVDEAYDVVHVSERAARYLQFASGVPSLNVLDVIVPELRLELRAALLQAAQTGSSVEARGLVVDTGDGLETVFLVVRPSPAEAGPSGGLFLVLFNASRRADGEADAPPGETVSAADPPVRRLEEENIGLRAQLRATVEQFETQAEEFKASNEELQAINEELRSTTEELETSREELQSVNEELSTVNQELKIKIEELSHANNDMRNLMSSTEIGTVFLDRVLRVKLFTPRARDVFNLIPADVGRSLRDIAGNLTDEELFADAERVVERLHTVEREVETRDGRVYLMQIVPYRTTDDRIDGVVMTFVDITRRRRAEERVRQSEAHYRALFNLVDEGFCTIEVIFDDAGRPVDHRIVDANPAFERHMGIQDPIGKVASELAPGIEQFWNDTYARVVATGHAARVEQYSEALGRTLEVFMARIGEEEGGLVAALFYDISERKRAEAELRASEERLRLVLESAYDYAIFTIDTGGRIETWNAGAERMFGYTEAEAVGRHTAMIFTPEDRERGAPDEEMRQARETGRASDERWHLRRDGVRFYVSGVLTPLHRDGALAGYVKVARDLTDRKRLEDDLRTAHDDLEARVRERTHELERVAAELRTEIEERRRVEAQVRELLRRLVNVQENERRRIARELHDELGQQMTALRLRLKAAMEAARETAEVLSRVEEAQALAAEVDASVGYLAWEMRPPALDVLGVAQALANFTTAWSKQFGVEADFHGADFGSQRLAAEVETNLYRILQEALQNVQKHAGASHVDVLLERRGDHVVLIVEDNGVGYDPSAEVAADTSKGMGLVNMRERSWIMGGTLDVETAPGSGVTIFVRVPLHPKPPRPASEGVASDD